MMKWEPIETDTFSGAAVLYRAKVPGGWLVCLLFGQASITFLPDPKHAWDGSSPA